MKESISAVSIFQIVILFILLFTAIMCLTINNANAFGIKDEITNIVELSNGEFLEDGKLSKEIVTAIENSAYRTTGKCLEGFTGFQRDGTKINGDGPASICIRCVSVSNEINDYLKSILGQNVVGPQGNVKSFYYQVEVFYQLDLPVINKVYNMKSKGETKIIYQNY